MNFLLAKHIITLAAGQLASRTFLRRMRLEVLQGRVWVTSSGMREDFWLGKGESLVLKTGRFTVIEADKEPSVVQLSRVKEPGMRKVAMKSGKKSRVERKLDMQCC